MLEIGLIAIDYPRTQGSKEDINRTEWKRSRSQKRSSRIGGKRQRVKKDDEGTSH